MHGSRTRWERAGICGVCTVCLGQLRYRYQLVEKWTVPLRQDDAILQRPALQLILHSSISPLELILEPILHGTSTGSVGG
jgi:hypothetical protein